MRVDYFFFSRPFIVLFWSVFRRRDTFVHHEFSFLPALLQRFFLSFFRPLFRSLRRFWANANIRFLVTNVVLHMVVCQQPSELIVSHERSVDSLFGEGCWSCKNISLLWAASQLLFRLRFCLRTTNGDIFSCFPAFSFCLFTGVISKIHMDNKLIYSFTWSPHHRSSF